MIQIKDKKKCSGCEACMQKCPVQCITMQADNEGFLYPKVDESKCIECKACERVCQYLYPSGISTSHLTTYAAINKDEQIRFQSSSGGLFYALASFVIKEKQGVVFGVRFDEQWNTTFDYTETLDGVKPFMGSKYVQSVMNNAYKDVERFLLEGREVLFTGTPCQIRGLKRYLKKEYSNLYCVAILCHGVPSRKVWQTYLASLGEQINNVRFRSKLHGWKNYSIEVNYKDSNTATLVDYRQSFKNDAYMNAFLSELSIRPSCYKCDFKVEETHADLIIGDFWHIAQIDVSMDDDKGMSLVVGCSKKGETLLSSLDLTIIETSKEDTIKSDVNGGFAKEIPMHPNRTKFFAKLGNVDFEQLVNNANNNLPILYRIHRKSKMIIHKYFSL